MFYREAGDFKTSYAADQALIPLRQDRWLVYGLLAIGFLVVPLFLDDYWANAIYLPFLIYTLAAIGLNILTGYCGQLSLGTGAFLAVGAYACYKLTTAFPETPVVFHFLASGAITAGVGLLFGLPSLRIKGFYLAVATLAAQFFIIWLFYKVPWFYNDNATGQINMPPRTLFGSWGGEAVGPLLTGAAANPKVEYLVVLAIVVLFTLIAMNLTRGRIGRSWMAIRDMDIAAELIGIRPLATKLLAFSVSSFYIGLAGSMMFAIWLGNAESGETFGITESFQVLFMIIIGGLGTITGSYLGAAFIILMPILLKNFLVDFLPNAVNKLVAWIGITGYELQISAVFAKHVEIMLMGTLIMAFLIIEPHGFARLWQIVKEKLRVWPFPYG